jgi:hypothetical protein
VTATPITTEAQPHSETSANGAGARVPAPKKRMLIIRMPITDTA